MKSRWVQVKYATSRRSRGSLRQHGSLIEFERDLKCVCLLLAFSLLLNYIIIYKSIGCDLAVYEMETMLPDISCLK